MHFIDNSVGQCGELNICEMARASTGTDCVQTLLRTVPTKYFWAVYDFLRKADLSKGYWNPKRKLGVTTHFLEQQLF